MNVKTFCQEGNFLKPERALLPAEPHEIIRDFERAMLCQFSQEDEDLFNAWGQRVNMDDLLTNLTGKAIKPFDPIGEDWTKWRTKWRETDGLQYTESHAYGVRVWDRVPSLATCTEDIQELFPRQLLGQFEHLVSHLLWMDERNYTWSSELSILWSFWKAGYFPCGYLGDWPENGSYVLLEPH